MREGKKLVQPVWKTGFAGGSAVKNPTIYGMFCKQFDCQKSSDDQQTFLLQERREKDGKVGTESIFCFDNEISCGFMLLRLFFSSQKLKANLICLNYPIVDLFTVAK